MSLKQLIKYSLLPHLRTSGLLSNWIRLPTDPPSQYYALSTLKRLGFTPSIAIDIGAYHGSWSREYLRLFPRTTNLLLVEPNPYSYSILSNNLIDLRSISRNVEVLDIALGKESQAQRKFFAMETGSSFYPELSPYSREEVNVRTSSLDQVVADTQFTSPDIIKIDTQGSELEILQGSSHVLGTLSVLQLEVSIVPSNRGGVLYQDVLDFLHNLGFFLFDVNQLIRRKDGVLWQLDLTFCSASLMDKIRVPVVDSNNWL